MGNTRDTGYLRNIIAYDASDNITLPARLAVTSTVAINNTTPYDTTQFSLDVNGGLIVKNTGKTAQIALINSNPAAGGNAGFVIHTVGGTSTSSYADIQGYYGTSIAGSTVIRLNPQGGNVLVGSLAGTGSRMVVADSTGVLSTQAIITLGDLSGTPTSRTLTINGVTYDLTANRSWSALPVGGVAGDILAKVDGTDYNATWIPNYTSTVQHTVKAGVALTKGQAVYVSSADGTNMIVSKASNASEQTSSKTLGLVAQNLAINGQGFVVTEGLLAGLNTNGANAGDPVWLGTDGNLIFGLLNKPTAPAHLVFIGVVTRVNANNGEIFVKVQNGFELDELHDLSVKNASDGDMIKYVASTGLWTKIAASTTNIVEGTNLYYTTARANTDFDTRLATKSTSNLSEGTNLYYTDTRVGTYLTNNSYATQTYVNTAVSNLVDAAPGTLDTLNELAAALGDDPNFATTVATSIGTKVPNTRTITINGTAYDLSADRSWTINSMVYPGAGIAVSTGSAWGTSITNNSTNWNTAYGWGNHASAGYLTSITSGNVTTALGFTPYNATNPSGYITGISFANVSSKPTTLSGYGITDALNNVVTSEQTIGFRYAQINNSDKTIKFDPRWNESTYDADLGTLHIYSTTAAGADYGRAGIALYNGSAYQYITTKASTTGVFVNNTQIVTNSGTWGINVSGNAATSTIFNNGSLYVSTANGNTLNSGFSNPGDGNDIWINYRGYNDSFSHFRDFRVGDGKGAQVALFTGSNKSLVVAGTVTASNISGTNTGDQTNISGNAATASSVAWSGISTGYRENYVLGFRPSDNSSSYAGFQFASPGNDSNAGYFLVRGGADNDVYTQNGLTIVADLGWLTLAQRTTAGRGVRIMTGTSSATRITVTDATTTISNTLTAGGTINIDGSLRFQSSDDRRLYGASVGSGYNCVRVQGNWNTFDIMGRVIDWTGSNLHFGNGYNGEDHSSYYAVLGNPVSYFKVEGPIYATGDIIAYYSDRRLKQNIKPIDSALSIIDKIGAYTFEWNKKSEEVWAKKEGDQDFGLISQEVEAAWPLGVAIQGGKDINDKYDYGNPDSPYYDPLHVEKNPEEYKTVRYDKMVTLAIAAIKEQQTQIESQKSEIEELKDLVKQLINR